nr:adenylate/guanylate cyclase domain-containing protein [Spirochaetota bacterium]
ALDRRLKYQRVLIATAILLVVISLAAEVAFHFRYAPLFAIPDQYAFPIAASVISGMMVSLIVMSYYFYKQTSYAEINLEKEKKKSDLLLLNVLPAEVADELKRAGVSKPSRIENVTVLFADFHGFHALAEYMTPEELIDELDLCFTKFDKIIERHGLEKLKTMGHAYMCAAGVPRGNRSAAADCVEAAMEMLAFMKEMKRDKTANGEKYWDVRIGMNTGPVVAGVIGNRKFVYDIWGDTVNVASRMLTTGLPGKINISRSTYSAVRQHYACRFRGKVRAKNKGRLDQFYVQTRA